MEISEGARWARYFLGDDAAPAPPDGAFARQLLGASADPKKTEYHRLVAGWMGKLAPAIQRMSADTIDIVGNAHIDAAWLWRWDETVDVVRNTWRTAAKLLEKYPGTTFAGSAAAYYEWVKEYEPSLFAELQRLQKEGRWAAVGGWWVESDANLPSGEAFVRQGLYGQRAYERFFGTTAKVAWIPDTFGYAFTLPQIFKKEGLDFFVTQKLRWNDTDQWTADKNLFWWEGRDGTRILTYIPYGYSDILDPQQLADRYKASKDSTASGRMMVLYGEGDHGGGPTMKMLDRAETLRRIPTFPTLHGDLPVNVLEKMNAHADSAPVIHDELYLEYHRGVYTSQSEMKEWNRRMEGLLGATEVAAAHASFFAPDDAWYNYPRGALTRAWEKTLFNQFHDLLPGSGIGPIYTDAVADYREAERVTDLELGRAADMIAGRMDTRPPVEGGRPYVVLNPSGHARAGVVTIPWSSGPVGVVDSAGRPLPSAVRGDTLRVRVSDVPATGGVMVFVVPGETAGGVPAGTTASTEGDHVVLQNRRLRVEIDRSTGEIAKIVDRDSGRDVLQAAGGGNRLATRYDKPAQWDAWNIDDTDDPWVPVADTVQVSEPGRNALGAWVDVVRADSTGRYEQRLMLPDGQARLEVDTHALWRADHRLLKASFPLAISFDSTWAEVPYGAIERPAVPRTRRDSARYEVSMQRWVDASDGTRGVGLSTDSKHGFDVRTDTLRLTLLKAPKYPDSTADMGWHHFRYDLVVHEGGWRSGAVERVADDLNEPLHALPVPAHEGQGRARAFLTVTGEGVDLGALKMAEDGGDLVVRLVERHGRPVTAGLALPWPFEWRPADLLERPDTTVGWTESVGDRATVPLKPWEIATVLVRRR
jgi:alpha-mannosidase